MLLSIQLVSIAYTGVSNFAFCDLAAEKALSGKK